MRFHLRRLAAIACAALSVCMAMAGAAGFTIHPLPTQRQLPMASIHCILQDAEGYFWYGTADAGVCRDNGYQVDVFQPESDNRKAACDMSCLAEDACGRVFLGTADGLFYLDKGDYGLHRMAGIPAATRVEALYAAPSGLMWCGMKGCVVAIDSALAVAERHPVGIGGKETSVAFFYEDSRGQLFALLWPPRGGRQAEILCRKKGARDFEPTGWPLPNAPLQIVEDKRNQCYWILTSGAGIVKGVLSGGKWQLTPQPVTMEGEGRNRGLSMLRDKHHGLLWCTTMDNLYAYRIGDGGQLHPHALDGLVPDGYKILDQLHEDHDGNIYVSGFTPTTFILSPEQRGVERIDAPAIRRQTGYPLLADYSVPDGDRFWIWQGRHGVFFYDPASDQAVSAPWKLDRTLARREGGGMYATDGTAVYRVWYDDGARAIRREELLRCRHGVRLLREWGGKMLYVATSRTLYRYATVGGYLEALATLPASPTDMDIDNQGNVYLAFGTGGLYRVSPRGQLFRVMRTGENFQALAVAPDGTVWASTHEGEIYHYLPAKKRACKERFLSRQLGKATVKDILVDEIGHVWALSDQVVCEYEPSTSSFRTIRSTDPSVDVSYFYTLEHISSCRIGLNAAGALLKVQSTTALGRKSVSESLPRVSSVVIGERVCMVGRDARRIALLPDEQDVALRLTTLDHLHAADICFAYRLEGVNRDWVYLPQGVNTVILDNVAQGEHALFVKATDRFGCWGSSVEVLTVHREAHWHETWWAYLLYIGIAAVCGVFVWKVEKRIRLLRRLISRKREVRLDEIELKREDFAQLKVNDEFLRKAVALVEAHMADEEYSVEMLSNDMCMSRVTFYRRMQEQTGQTPSEFIRDIRLKNAARMLVQFPDAAMADIAAKVGFAQPKYFSKWFKEKFGMSPTDYRRNHRDEPPQP